MILFLVNPPNTNIRFFTWASDREDAKRKAARWIGGGWGDADRWTVEPLTNAGDRVKLDITLSI